MTMVEGERGGAADSVLESKRQRLIDIVRTRSLARGTRVRLTSGAESSFYFDMKPTLFDPEGAALIADLVLAQVRRDGAEFVGGLEMGAVPIVACIVQRSFLVAEAAGVPGFFVRKAAKEHGTRRLVEGMVAGAALAGRRALVVEDVTTTGLVGAGSGRGGARGGSRGRHGGHGRRPARGRGGKLFARGPRAEGADDRARLRDRRLRHTARSTRRRCAGHEELARLRSRV